MSITFFRKMRCHYYISVDDLSFVVKGSAEEQIKQELQAVAEGVAASVLQSSIPPMPTFSGRERNESSSEPNQDGVHQYEETENTVAKVILNQVIKGAFGITRNMVVLNILTEWIFDPFWMLCRNQTLRWLIYCFSYPPLLYLLIAPLMMI